jgi:hypothetical protein
MNYRMCKIVVQTLLLLLLFTMAAPSSASDLEDAENNDDSLDLFDDDTESKDNGWPLFNIAAGVTYLEADGVLGVRPPNSPPVTIINFDRIGLDESDASHWLTLTWRSRNTRWGAWFSNWRYDVNGQRSWSDDWPLDENISIPVGARLDSRFDANWFVLEATYSFFQNETIDAGIGIGFHIVDLKTDLSAQIDVGDQSVEIYRGDLDTIAPLPNILAYMHWRFHPRWETVMRAGWFGLDYDIYSGAMANAHAMLSFRASERFSLGAGYQFVRLDLDIERKTYQEIYDIDVFGPLLFARFRF